MRKKTHSSSGGFTLVETIMAMFILGMVLIVLQASLSGFAKTNAASRNLSAATSLGNKMLEAIRATPYASIVSSSGSVAGTKYYQVTTVSADVNNRKKTVAVILAWPLPAPTRRITLSTIVAR